MVQEFYRVAVRHLAKRSHNSLHTSSLPGSAGVQKENMKNEIDKFIERQRETHESPTQTHL